MTDLETALHAFFSACVAAGASRAEALTAAYTAVGRVETAFTAIHSPYCDDAADDVWA